MVSWRPAWATWQDTVSKNQTKYTEAKGCGLGREGWLRLEALSSIVSPDRKTHTLEQDSLAEV